MAACGGARRVTLRRPVVRRGSSVVRRRRGIPSQGRHADVPPLPTCRHAAGADQQTPNALFVFAVDAGVSNPHGKAISLFDRVRDGSTGQSDFDFVLNVFNRDAVPRGLFAVDVDLQIALSHDRRGDHVAGAVDRFQGRFDRLADTVDRVQVLAEYLHPDVGAHAGREHFDAVDDRLREDVAPTGHLQHSPHFVIDQIALGSGLSRPEEDSAWRRPHPGPCAVR